jgi:hypothetical protein
MNSAFKYVEIGEVDEPKPDEYVDIDTPSKTSNKISELIKDIENDNDVFLFIFMQTCHPCKNAKPEWKKLKGLVHKGVVVALLNEKLLNNADSKKLLSLIGKEPSGFPTFKHIKGKRVEDYEGDRNEDALKAWVNSKSGSSNGSGSGSMIGGKKQTIRNKRKLRKGKKWSMKYKKSINCKRPKGFSQKQHCKYGRKRWSKNK